MCYVHGVCVKTDIPKTIKLLSDASQNNNPIALWLLAKLLANHSEPDLLRARCYLEKMEKITKNEVGILGNVQIRKDIFEINERFRKQCAFLLVKVVPECVEDGQPEDKYVQDLLDGKLFMKTLEQFGNIKKRDASSDNDFRGDILEGYAESFGLGYNPHSYFTDKKGTILGGTLGAIDVLALRKKTYCLTAIDYYKVERVLIKPSEKMKKFGKFAVIITDVDKFLERVRKAFNRYCKENNSSYELNYDKVSYDVDLHEKFIYNEFHKSMSYSWQNEFRISIDFTEGKFSAALLDEMTDFVKVTFPGKIELDTNPLSLSDWIYFEIGDIRDIAKCVEVEALFNEKFDSIDINKEPISVEPHITPHKPRPTICKEVMEVVFSDGTHHLAVSEDATFTVIL